MPRASKLPAPATAKAALPKMPAKLPKAPAMPSLGAPNVAQRSLRMPKPPTMRNVKP